MTNSKLFLEKKTKHQIEIKLREKTVTFANLKYYNHFVKSC